MATLYPIGGLDTPIDMYSARDLGKHNGTATAVAWSCTAHRLASGGVDGVVKIWAPEKTRPSYNVNLQQQMTAAAQQGQQQPGLQQATEPPVGEIRLPSVSSSSSQQQQQQRGRPPRIARLTWHPRVADVLAVASDDGATVRLFDARTGEAPRKRGSSSVSPSPSSSPSFIASFTPPAPMSRCTAISLSWCPSPLRANLLAVGTDADVISFHDVSSEGAGKVLALLPPPLPGTEVNEAVFSADGTVFARAVGAGGAVELFSVEELLKSSSSSSIRSSSIPSTSSAIPSAATAASAAASIPTTSSEWKRARSSVKPFATLRGHTATVFALSAVANAAAAASASADGDVGAAGAAGMTTTTGPAAHLLASGGADGAAVVWDLRFGGSPLATCGSFDMQVKCVSLGGGWCGGGQQQQHWKRGCFSPSPSPSSSQSNALGSMIAYAGEGDVVVVEDWTRSPRNGGFLPPRPATAPHLCPFSPRPFAVTVRVPRVEAVAWAPAAAGAAAFAASVNGGGEGAAPKSAAASGPPPSSSLDRRPRSPRSSASFASSASSASSTQANAGALAFTRNFSRNSSSSSSSSSMGQMSGSRSLDSIGAIGITAPPPASFPLR